ncbi:MAG TPA: hypothetical protein DCS93_44010 [Microscillaceae bacterium]|nr:hypothetical protein [Microscillaceae bacterium]
MELDEFKAQWQNANPTPKHQSELQQMTKIRRHPQLKKIKRRLVIEIVLLTIFLLVFQDFFDGPQKPVWANVLLISGILSSIITNIWGYIVLFTPIKATNLRTSLKAYLQQLRRMAWFSVISSLYYGTTLLLFFAANLSLTPKKYAFIAMMVGFLLMMVYFSYKLWQNHIQRIKDALERF